MSNVANPVPSPTKVYRHDCTPEEWREFIAVKNSGEVFECDREMYWYFLEVLPPAWMDRTIEIHGKLVRTHFGLAEGYETVTAFWMEGDRYFGCRTTIMNPQPW